MSICGEGCEERCLYPDPRCVGLTCIKEGNMIRRRIRFDYDGQIED